MAEPIQYRPVDSVGKEEQKITQKLEETRQRTEIRIVLTFSKYKTLQNDLRSYNHVHITLLS